MSILLADIDATCAALGYSDGQRYQAEPDAIQGLKHIIWILRRDLENHEYRRHLGRSKVLQTDLVYMLPDYVDDDEFADVLIRLLVILTNPSLLLYRDGPPKDNHGRKVFMELIDILQGYKSAFTRDKVWAALYGKLQKALEIDWSLRSEEQSLLIERILVLIRNVLQVPANPEAECRADNDASLHDQVIWALHQSGMLDLVLFVISSPDEHQFHLHGLEILCLLYREQTAESLADASLQRSYSEKQRDEQELIAWRRREKQRLVAKPPPGRHSRFGGTYVIRNLKSVSDRDIICHQPLERVAALDFDREKAQQKRSFRHVKEEAKVTRRSAFSVRLCLREYCIEILRSAYNTLVRQVRRVLERNFSATSSHDDSYLLWAIQFFMEFNRLSGLQLQFVSESLSVQCFHWVLTRMEHNMDMIMTDKKQARLWAKRLHVALQTFRELLQSLLALQKLQDDKAQALFDMLLNNVCYVLEYRKTVIQLLMNYNEAHSTKVFLRDVVETANIFLKMMEKFCKDSVVVQDKKRGGTKRRKNKTSQKKSTEELEEELANRWVEMSNELCTLLSNELQIPEEQQPIPFDATSEISIEDQKDECLKRLNQLLRNREMEQAIALLRAAREVWPENDVFGAISASPDDELLLLHEIFMHTITTEINPDENPDEDHFNDDEENAEIEDNLVEKAFKFEDFAKSLLNPKVVRACTVVLTDWSQIPTKSLKAAVTILHRIAYGCSCPAMLFQVKLFRIFQQVFHAARDAHSEELRRLGIFVMRKFVSIAPTNPKIYAELLFYKSIREANELETGYCDNYDTGTKGKWTEAQEEELRLLFEENQRNPETDMDVIDWILENLIDKTRTRRGVLKKLKELGLMFKAPTRKSLASAVNKNLWKLEEDNELKMLYDQFRLEEDCLQRILVAMDARRNKQQIIKRMLQLHLIADKSEIMPPKWKKKKSKKNGDDGNESGEESPEDDGYEHMEEPHLEGDTYSRSNHKIKIKVKKSKSKSTKKPKKSQRKIVRTPFDVNMVRALLSQLDAEKYQQGLDWLKECLEEAAEEEEEPLDDEDGVPLVTITEAQKEAMEDANFQKILIALGMQPPVMGMETYWRIPTYLNIADLKIRAKILGGEEIEMNNDNDRDEQNDQEDEEDTSDNSEEETDDNEDDIATNANSAPKHADSESEEDFFDGYMARKHGTDSAMDNIMKEQRQKLDSLMFTKSDNEQEMREPLKEKKKRNKQQKSKSKKAKITTDSEEDDEDLVDEITKKLNRKKYNPDESSDEENLELEKEVKKRSTIEKKKRTKKAKETLPVEETAAPTTNVNDLFDQLKAKRTKKIKLSEMLLENDEDFSDDDTGNDALNFNSEDLRKRLLELGDSDAEEQEKEEQGKTKNTFNDDDDDDIEQITVIETKKRTRRANVIDSDSDEDQDENEYEQKKQQSTSYENKNQGNDNNSAETLTKKRQREKESDIEVSEEKKNGQSDKEYTATIIEDRITNKHKKRKSSVDQSLMTATNVASTIFATNYVNKEDGE